MAYSFERGLDFRATDPDAHCGPRGYLELFQAAVTEHMHQYDLGNDVLPYKFGIGWIFTRYRLHILAKADSLSMMELTTWVSGKPGRRFMTHEFALHQKGELMAEGRLECCFFDLARQRVTTPAAVDFPNALYEPGWVDVGPFRRLDRNPKGAAPIFSHTVRYCDLDNNGHMNNLRYVNLVLDAFTKDELDAHPVRDIEINFLNQCRELETVTVCRRDSVGSADENSEANGPVSDLYVLAPKNQLACRVRTEHAS